MRKAIAGIIVISCVMAAAFICSATLTEARASRVTPLVESNEQPTPTSCILNGLKKSCCPGYCSAPSTQKDKVFDKCAAGMGCDEYKGHGFSTCNSSCKD